MGIVDYGMGNLGSVLNACRYLGVSADILEGPERAVACRALILPGVGAFGDGMDELRRRGWVSVLDAWVRDDRPLLGICLGLQLLFDASDESPGVPGLGWIRGNVRRFPERPGLKVPHMGWNRVRQVRADPLWQGVPDGAHFYFVHSYFPVPADPDVVTGRTEYGLEFCSAIRWRNVFAVQFHPEKSHEAGLRLLANFAQSVGIRSEERGR